MLIVFLNEMTQVRNMTNVGVKTLDALSSSPLIVFQFTAITDLRIKNEEIRVFKDEGQDAAAVSWLRLLLP